MADCRIGEPRRAQLAQAWPALLDAIAAGELVLPAIRAAGFSVGEVRAFRAYAPENDAAWQRAKEESADAYFDEVRALIVADISGADAAGARVKMDGLRWLASKRNPRVYSDKQTLDVTVKHVDLARIIDAAQARLLAGQAGRTIEGIVLRAALPASVEDIL